MRKLITIISSLLFVTIVSAKAEIGIGVSGSIHMLDASGTETTRQSLQQNKGSHDEVVAVPEIFVEAVDDNGFAVGVSYIPTRDLDGQSRTDTETVTGRDSGTYTAKAELDNVIKLYTDIPTGGGFYGGDVYLHLGLQHVTLKTLESLNSGATYPDKDLLGGTAGLGVKGDLPYANMYYKDEVTYTQFESYEADGAGNTVNADIEDYAARFSVGYKF